jgi:diguanylate cyclase (GGDEF)-like protein
MTNHRGAIARALRGDKDACAALDAVSEPILCVDLDSKITYLNQAAEEMTGWRLGEARGLPAENVFRLVTGDTGESVRDGVRMSAPDVKPAVAKAICANRILVRRDGLQTTFESEVEVMYDQQGAASGALLSFSYIGPPADSIQMRAARQDFLTGLPNRMLFNDLTARSILLAQRAGARLAVMFVDIDHFKHINDSMGHAVGDKLLQSIGERLRACVRQSDVVSRLGGDEFGVLLAPIDGEGAAARCAGKIITSLSAPHMVDGKRLDIQVSIGVSTFPSDGKTCTDLVKRADDATYETKRRGRNGYRFFLPEMHLRFAERQSLEADLRCALGQNEFVLHYQPKVDLNSKKITGMEALIRWSRPRHTLVFPDQFVPVAQDTGLIVPIGAWVILQACRQSKAWEAEGLGVIPMAVNVSAGEFNGADFVPMVRASLLATHFDPVNLELEVTESSLFHDVEASVNKMKALKAIGVRIAIDDFGIGYSNFSYLMRFPSDSLKLHQSFVQQITVDPRAATIPTARVFPKPSLLRADVESVP